VSVRVLVVDDDPVVRRAIQIVLARGGFDVSVANDGSEGCDVAADSPPDIAVIDFHMPTPGLEVVRSLKAKYAERVFVAVLTGVDYPEMREECLTAGADAVLIKPIAPLELRRRLAAAAVALKTPPAAS
jgi:DNA-binding response OmpR family regulator